MKICGGKPFRVVVAFFAAIIFSGLNTNLAFAQSAAFKVEGIEAIDQAENVIVNTPTVDGSNISHKVVFHELGDFVTYRLRIKSLLSKVKIIDITDNSSSSYIHYTYSNHADEVVNKNGNLVLDVTIAFDADITQYSDRFYNEDVSFSISYINVQTNEEETYEIALVPDTGVAPKMGSVGGSEKKLVDEVVVFVIVGVFSFVVALVVRNRKAKVVACAAVVAMGCIAIHRSIAIAEDYAEQEMIFSSSIDIKGTISYVVHGDGFDRSNYFTYKRYQTYREFFNDAVNVGSTGKVVVGYQFMDGTDVSLDDKILDDFEINVLYDAKTYTVQFNNTENGTVVDIKPGRHGENSEVGTFVPADGYYVPKKITCTNNQKGTISKDGKIVIEGITSNTICRVVGDPPSFFTITYLQEMTKSYCNAETTPVNAAKEYDTDGSHRGRNTYVPQTTLIDARDGNEYLVRKLGDGKCWIVNNMRIAGTTLTPEDSNVAEDFELPEPYDLNSGVTFDSNEHDVVRLVYDDEFGGYYNWYTATVGYGTYGISHQGGSQYSICPKGWTLPDSAAIYNVVGSYNGWQTFNIEYGGMMYSNGSVINYGTFAGYWSKHDESRYDRLMSADYTNIGKMNNYLSKSYTTKTNFLNVRCVAQQ